MAVANSDVDESRGAQRGGALIDTRHVVSNAFEAEEFHHLGGIGAGSAAQPIARNESPAGAQHPQHFGIYRGLVRDLNHRVLGEDHIEARRRKRQRAHLNFLAADALREAGPFDALLHFGEKGWIDVDTDHRSRAVLLDQQLIDDSQTTADIEHLAVADAAAFQQPRDLVDAARRQEPVAPNDLQQRQHACVIFASFTRLTYFYVAHCASISANSDFAPYTLPSASRMIAGCTAIARFRAASNQ